MKYNIFNLNYPLGHSKLKIGNYVFDKLDKPVTKKSGHTLTSIAQNIRKETNAKIGNYPKSKSRTELDDICLVLSLFTSNDVHYASKDSINCLYADPRPFASSILSSGLNTSFVHQNENLIVNGFEEEINKVLKLIRSRKWLTTYNKGSFLLMMKDALRKQSRESSYLNCWIICEHLFYISNRSFFSDTTLKRISAKDKINFLLTKYIFETGINKKENNKLQELADIRNYIVHTGFSPIYTSLPKEFWLFINITQFIVAKILQLYPNDFFNTIELFEKYLNEKKDGNKVKKFFE